MGSKKNSVIFNILANTKKYAAGMGDVTKMTDVATKAMKIAFAAVAIAAVAATVKFAKFEQGLSDISTLLNTSKESIKGIGDGILEVSKRVSKPIDELVESMYDIRSAGIAADKAMGTLTAAGKLAVTGLSTTKEATDILTTSMNSFKSEGYSANQIINILFKTVKFGKNTIADLSQSFGQTAPLAKAAGLSLIEFSAATAALTAQGIPASVSQNQIRAAMVGLERQTKQMKTVFRQLGFKDMRGLLANSDNLGHAFKRIRDTAKELDIPLAKVTGRVEGANAITVIATEGAEIYNKALTSMADGSDLVTEKFEEQQKTLMAQKQLMENYINVVLIKLGSKLQPALVSLNAMIMKVLESLQGVVESNGKTITSVFTFIVNTVTSALSVLSQLGQAVLGIFDAMGGFYIIAALGAELRVVVEIIRVLATVINTVVKSINGFLDDIGVAGTIIKAMTATLILYIFSAKAVVIATKAWALAQASVNLVMKANPLGLLLFGIVALGAVIYDIIVNTNEWAIAWEKTVNSIIINWKKAKQIFSGSEASDALQKEIDALEKQNELLEAQSKALKKRKEELKEKGMSSGEADKKAGEELDSGKLGKEVAKFKSAEDAKTGIQTEAEKKRLELKKMDAEARMEQDIAENDLRLQKMIETGILEQEVEAEIKKRDFDNKLKIEKQYLTDKKTMGVRFAKANKAVNEFYANQEIKNFRDNSSHLTAMADSKNKTLAGIGKAATIFKIATDTPAAAMGAYKAMAGIPIVGPALGIAAAAAASLYGAEQLMRVKNSSYAVGTDFVPNDMLANIHKGEGIIPAKENQFLQSGKLALTAPEVINKNVNNEEDDDVPEAQLNISMTANIVEFFEMEVVRRRKLGVSLI